MKVLWIAGLPEEVRMAHPITDVRSAAWSWVMGSLPPPEDVELHVVCPVFGMREREAHFDYAGAHWHCFRLKRFEPLFLRWRFARQIRPFVRKLKPDVVHGWGGESGCGLVATYLSKRAVVSVQGLLRMLRAGIRKWRIGDCADERGPAYWLRCLMESMTYRRARCLICESKTSQTWLRTCHGRDALVVPHPLRKEFLGGGIPVSDNARDGHVRVKFLFVGQDVPRKGIEDLREVGRRNHEFDITYVTGGRSAAEIAELMRIHDAFVLPSYGDTGPTAIKEALAMGMPVIAYDNTGPKELIEKYGGTLVETGNIGALAAALAEAKSSRFVEVGNRIRQDLSRESVWAKLTQVYSKVVK